MIVIRDIFQLEFGKARDAIASLNEGRRHLETHGHQPARLLTDVTGEFYTLIMENQYESLADYEASLQQIFQDPGWKEAYSRFVPFVRKGRREIFRIVD